MLETAAAASAVVGSALNAGEGIGRVALQDSQHQQLSTVGPLTGYGGIEYVRGCCALVSWGWLCWLV